MNNLLHRYLFICVMALMFLMLSCDQTDHTIADDPYAGGRQQLGIQLLGDAPVPSAAYPGDTVVFNSKGLLQWCDTENKSYEFDFYLADEKSKIAEVTETSISIVVPENVSTGITYILMQGQVFYGPRLTVLGNIRVDNEYGIRTGVIGELLCYLPHRDGSGDVYLAGSFSNINGQPGNSIALADRRGNLMANNSGKFDVSTPVNSGGSVTSMSYFSDGRVLISGTISSYQNPGNPGGTNYLANHVMWVNNITVLNSNFSALIVVDTMYTNGVMQRINTPVFNGGTDQNIIRSFVTSDDNIIAVSNAAVYCRYNYKLSNSFGYATELSPAGNVMKMNGEGELDTEYRKNLSGPNAMILDAYRDRNEGLFITGEFTTFDGKNASRIVKLTPSGDRDETFMGNIGAGANGAIDMIRYNETLEKIVLTGKFTQFNGQPRNGVAILNSDGTTDNFNIREISGGYVNFAAALNCEKVVISGTFTKYNGISRGGFLILEMDGEAVQNYNMPGVFAGQLQQVMEIETTMGTYGLLLMGNFNRFNGERINNIVQIQVDFAD